MASSGSVNFTANRNDIINEALELVGVKDMEDPATAAQVTSCARSLNMLIKSLQSRGLFLWHTRDFYVFTGYNKRTYDLGPTGDHATLSYVKTEVATAQTSGNNTLVVDSITGISDADAIGIELDDKTLQWTTVSGAPSGSTITLTANLTDDVSVDANIFTYTTIINRPLWIKEDCRLYQDSATNEIPFTIDSRSAYNELTTKLTTGLPNQGWYDPQLTNGKLYVWPVPINVKNILYLTGKFPIEDFDAATDDADMPQEWYLPICWMLAVVIAPKFLHKSWDQINILTAQQMVDEVSSFDKDFGSFFIDME